MQSMLLRHCTTEEISATRPCGRTRSNSHHRFELYEVALGRMSVYMFVAAVTEAEQATIGSQNPQRSEMSGNRM